MNCTANCNVKSGPRKHKPIKKICLCNFVIKYMYHTKELEKPLFAKATGFYQGKVTFDKQFELGRRKVIKCYI